MLRHSAALLLVVAGCTPPPPLASWRPMMAPNGTPAAYVSCFQSEMYCFDEAQRACPYGYFVLDRNSANGVVAETQRTGLFHQTTTTVEPTFRGALLVQCRPYQGPQAPPPPLPPTAEKSN